MSLSRRPGSVAFFQTVPFIQQQHQRHHKGKTVCHRTGPQNALHAKGKWKQQRCRHKKYDLAGKRKKRGHDRLADRLEIYGNDRLKAGQRAEQQKDSEGFDRKFVVQTVLGAKQ